jgi:hypothetical protein
MKKVSKIVFWIFMVISICIITKFSNFPIIELPFDLDRFFIKPIETDGILFNLAIGYIVSAFFYLLVVFYPEKVKREKVERVAISELESISTEATMMAVLMYKNVSKNEEWNFEHLKDDAEFFDKKFYERITRFDAYKNADTLKCSIEDDGTMKNLTWDNILEDKLKDFSDRIDQIVTRYIYFLDDEIIDKALSFKNNNFIVAYLGLPSNRLISVYTGINGIKYAERVPWHMIRSDSYGEKTPLFQPNEMVDNVDLFRDYINTLLSLRELCLRKSKSKKDIAIEYFCRERCGQTDIAIFKE